MCTMSHTWYAESKHVGCSQCSANKCNKYGLLEEAEMKLIANTLN